MLSDAIMRGSIEDVSREIDRLDTVNYIDPYGYTPLIEAAIVNDLEKARLLLTAGADVNQPDITGRVPLHWVTNRYNLPFAETLLQHGANPNAYNTKSGESVLVTPLLREQSDLKALLLQYKANLPFAYDYIHAKLMGHRFELVGSVDIVDTQGVFVEVDYEGFYSEFCLKLVAESLRDFRHHFLARPLKPWVKYIHDTEILLENASQLLWYDHYWMDPREYELPIYRLLKRNPLVISLNQEGHAATVIQHHDVFAICDRAQDFWYKDKVPIFKIGRPQALTRQLWLDILYRHQSFNSIYHTLHEQLALEKIGEVPLFSSQRVGTCAWTSIECILPVLFFK